MYRWFLACRYLATRPINLLGMFGVTLGVWAMIVVVALFTGVMAVFAKHVRSVSADVYVLAVPESTGYAQLRELLLGDPDVAACAGRLLLPGILHRPGEPPGPPPLPGRGALQGSDGPFLTVLGIEPADEANTTAFADWLLAADPLLQVADRQRPLPATDGLPAMLVGETRMRAMGLHRGDHVVLTSARLHTARDNNQRGVDPIQQEFVVTGAFKAVHAGFEGINTFVQLDVLRKLLHTGNPDGVLEVAVRTKDPAQTEATAQRLELQLQNSLHLPRSQRSPVVWPWQRREHGLLQSVEHQRGLMQVVLFVILVVAAFLMYATLSMMATEKISDIGILTAMGGTPLGTMQVFLLCGLTVTVCGLLLGVVTGCLSAIYLDDFHRLLRDHCGIELFSTKVYNLDRVPYQLEPLWILQVCGLALLVGALVSALPAWRLSRHDPLVSLRGI